MSLFGVLDIRQEERRNTFAAFFTLLAITTGHTLLETARDALFLSKMPASRLPWMYLVIVAAALGLARLGKQVHTKVGIAVTLVAASGVTASFWVLTATRPSSLLLYALYVWTGLFASWVTIEFWTILGRVHTLTQAKRLYGFIGGGAVLGGVVGAVLARGIIEMFPPRAALVLAAALFATAAAPTLALRIPAAAEPPSPTSEAEARAPLTTGMMLLWENAFARRVLGIVLVSTVTVTLGDFLFKSVVAHEIHDASQLGALFSTFYAVTNTLGLVAQLVLAPWVFRTLGVQRALFFFPLAMLVAAGGVVTAAAAGGLLVAVVLLKGLDGVTRYSLHRTSMELLLVPVPDVIRERIKPIVEVLGTRGGQALASVAILFLVAVSAGKPKVIGAIVLTLAVVWLALVVTIRGLYLDVFRETLRSGGLSGKAELPALDLGALETLFAGLNSSRDGEVLGSLELLAEQHRERLIPALILYHPGREVVLRALEIFAGMGRTDFVPIADRLNAHPDREIAAAALRARTAVAPDHELLERRLGDSCSQVSVTALVALMARGWIDRENAEAHLARVFEVKSWNTAAELARAIRAIAPTRREEGPFEDRFDELLLRIDEAASGLRGVECEVDESEPEPAAAAAAAPAGAQSATPPPPAVPPDPPEIRVRLEVARAMGARKNPSSLPALVAMLRRHELRAAAREALRDIPGALDALDRAMTAAHVSPELRLQIPRAMTAFEPRTAARLLVRQLLVQDDGSLRYKILRALVKLRRQTKGIELDHAPLHRTAEATLDHAAELLRWGAALASESDEAATSTVRADPLRAAHYLLADLVRDKGIHTTQRLFLLLELLYEEDFEEILRGLRSASSKRRAGSLELVENLVRAPLRARVLALVGDGPQDVGPSMSYEEALREMIAKGGSTMRTIAQYRADEIGLDIGDGARAAARDDLAAALGRRLIERARDLVPDDMATGGVSRAPA